MPRIVAGSAKGRRIAAPEGDATRPTSDRMREGLFSALESMLGSWHGLAVLDLFAGSGAVGLEAASRGAASVVLVESDARALRTLKANVEHLGLPGTSVVASTVERFVQRAGGRFDVVFADPPYSMPAADLRAVLVELLARGAVAEGSVVVVERARRDAPWTWPPGLTGLRERAYGEGCLWYGRAAGPAGIEPTETRPE